MQFRELISKGDVCMLDVMKKVLPCAVYLCCLVGLASCDSKPTDKDSDAALLREKSESLYTRNNLQRRGEKNDPKSNILSKKEVDQLVEKIQAIDVTAGYTSDFVQLSIELINNDPDRALDVLYAGELLQSAIGFPTLCQEMYSVNPGRLLEWLKKDLPNMTDDKHLVGVYWATFARSVGKEDPDAVLSFLLSSYSSVGVSLETPIQGLFSVTAAENIRKAEELLSILPNNFKDSGLRGLAYSILQENPSKAYHYATQISAGEKSDALLAAVFRRWLSAVPEAAATELRNLSPKQFERIAVSGIQQERNFLGDLSKLEPNLLREKLAEIMPSSENAQVFEISLQGLARRDFDTALGVINDLPNGEFRDRLLAEPFAAIKKTDNLNKYIAIIGGLNAGDKIHAAHGLGIAIAKRPLEDILRLSRSFDKSTSSKLLLSALDNSSLVETAHFQKVINNREIMQILTPEDANRLTTDYSGRIALKLGKGAFDWYQELSAEQKMPAIKGIASAMSENDTVALGNWLNAMEESPEWYAAASIYTRHVKRIDREAARGWEESLNSYRNKNKARK